MMRLTTILAVALVLAEAGTPSRRPAAAEESRIEVLVAESSPTTRMTGGMLTGYWVELIGLAAARANVAVAFRVVPYARALREVGDGTNLCNPMVARTPEREAGYSWIAPTRRILISAFTLSGAEDPPPTIEALKQREIAVMRGTLGDLTLTALAIPVQRVADTDDLARLLEHGRVSIIVSDYQVAMATAAQASITIEEALRLSETPGYLACSPGLDPAIVERLGAELDAIFASGEDLPIAAANGLGDAYGVARPKPR